MISSNLSPLNWSWYEMARQKRCKKNFYYYYYKMSKREKRRVFFHFQGTDKKICNMIKNRILTTAFRQTEIKKIPPKNQPLKKEFFFFSSSLYLWKFSSDLPIDEKSKHQCKVLSLFFAWKKIVILWRKHHLLLSSEHYIWIIQLSLIIPRNLE